MQNWTEEIEVRFLVEAFRNIRPRLRLIGGQERRIAEERVVFYDTPDLAYDANGTRIRIKQRGNRGAFVVQQKDQRPDLPVPGVEGAFFKVRREFDAKSFPTLEEAETYLGEHFPGAEPVQGWTYRKKREHWEIPDVGSVELDTLIDLDDRKYVEIEANPEEIVKIAEALMLSWDSATAQGYRAEHLEARRG